MDLVDEQDVSVREAGQDRAHIAGFFQSGAGGNFNRGAELFGDKIGEGGLAQAGRAMEKEMFDGLIAFFGRSDQHF